MCERTIVELGDGLFEGVCSLSMINKVNRQKASDRVGEKLTCKYNKACPSLACGTIVRNLAISSRVGVMVGQTSDNVSGVGEGAGGSGYPLNLNSAVGLLSVMTRQASAMGVQPELPDYRKA